jgi:hypothetical protein
MDMLKKIVTIVAALLMAGLVQAESEFTEQQANPLYLKKMPEKIWWNKDYKHRIPILVSETIGKVRSKAVIHFECDFQQKVNPKSIRIVTPWEEELPSQINPISDSKVEILFQAGLRKYQNRPFFIYFGNPVAKQTNYDSDLSMKQRANELIVRNEKIQVCFGTNHKRSAKINSLKITGSDVPNQLTERYTGVTWSGFDLGKYKFTEKPEIKDDGLFKKTIVYKAKELSIEYSIYSSSPRIDFKIISHGAKKVSTETKWIAGGGDAYDLFYYEGKKGPLYFKAGPDKITDIGDYPRKTLTKWMREGWAALDDKRVNETVGTFWNPQSLSRFQYYMQTINGGETFYINFSLDKPVVGSLVAINGNWKKFRNNYIDWKNSPVITLGKMQNYSRNIQAKVPDYVKDFTCGFKFSERREGTRVSEDYADRIVQNIRKLGGNSAKLNIYNIESIPLTKEQYEKFQKVYNKYYSGKWKRSSFPQYKKSMATDSYLQGLTKAAHKQGVAVRTWTRVTPLKHPKTSFYNDPEAVQFVFDIYKSMAKAGVDLLQTSCAGEWSSGYKKHKNNPDAWFAVDKGHVDFAKKLQKEMKKDYPDLPLNSMSSVDGWLPKLQFMDEKAQYLDTLENEFCPGMIPNMATLKYGIKRLQGFLGNDGGAVHHHFYYYVPNSLYRVSEMECPMIFGVKGFGHENLQNSYSDKELNEITADFYRLTNYTSLDKFLAKCTPYKFMGVLRDGNEVKNDIRKKRIAMFPGKYSLHEARCKNIISLKNIPTDLVCNRFFKVDMFDKYKIIFIPSTESLSDKTVKEISKYIKNGGVVIAEGKVADNKKFAKLAGIVKAGNTAHKTIINSIPMGAPFRVKAAGAKVFLRDTQKKPALFIRNIGKGKLIYSPYILSDDLANSAKKSNWLRKEIFTLVGNAPIVPPVKLANRMESSLLKNGNEYFFGVYNPAYETELKGNIGIDIPTANKQFVLNVKTGKKTPFNGKVNVDIPPLQTGFFIIGSAATTALPKTRSARILGGASPITGMKFINKKINAFDFTFTKQGKTKVVGVLYINNKKGRQSQAHGALEIYETLKDTFKNVKFKLLENLQNKTINGCDALIVPNMGTGLPFQLQQKWWERVADFANQGGGVMLIHHSIGVGEVGEPAFPSIGSWSGAYYPVHNFKIVNKHPIVKGLPLGTVFTDTCWDYDQIKLGEDAMLIAKGLRKDGIPTPALVAGKYGKGHVVVSGIGIGCGQKMIDGKLKSVGLRPTGGLKIILINAVKWMLK